MELDIIVVPTIKGDLRLAEVDSTYLCVAVIDLPHGPIEISDRFYYPVIILIYKCKSYSYHNFNFF